MSDLKRGMELFTKKLLKFIAVLLTIVHCVILAEMIHMGVKPMIVYNISLQSVLLTKSIIMQSS